MAAASFHALLIAVVLLVVGVVVPAPPITPPVQMVFVAPMEPAPAAEPSAVTPAPDASAEAVEPPPSPEAKPPTPTIEPGPLPSASPPEAAEPAPVPPPPTPSAVPEPTARARPSAVPSPPRPRPQHLQVAKTVLPQPATSAPSAPEAPATPAAPSVPAPPSAAAPTPVSPGWRQALAGWLAQHKSYPEEARRRGMQGAVLIRFTVDRTGHVVDAVVLRGSGSPLLDDATVAMLRGATVPAPSGLTVEQITVSVQVHYALTD